MRLPRIALAMRPLMLADNISIGEQDEIYRIARSWCIPPYEVHRHGLQHRPDAATSLIYDVETSAFHRLMNGDSAAVSADLELLRDKLAVAAALERLGVPVVKTFATGVRYDSRPFRALFPEPRALFCKLRSGHASDRAFSAWPDGDGYAGCTIDGAVLPDTSAVEKAWQAITARGEVLVQPLLRNGAALAPMAHDGMLATVRYVSRRTDHGPVAYFAVLEIPAPPDPATGLARHALMPLATEDGALRDWRGDTGCSTEARELLEWARCRAPALQHVPHWQEIQTLSHAAQRRVDRLWAVAWDWAITPSGPVLLEGNGGWGLAVPQLLLNTPFISQVLARSSASQRLSQ